MSDEVYYHAEHCGINVDMKLSDPDGNPIQDANAPDELKPMKCVGCEIMEITPKRVTRFEHERYTAIDDDCLNCGQSIRFLADRLTWVHDQDNVPVTEPDYGLLTCEAAMVALLGLPAVSLPEYAGKGAEPRNISLTLDLKTGEQQTPEEQAEEIKVKAEKKAKRDANAKAVTALSPSLRKSILGS